MIKHDIKDLIAHAALGQGLWKLMGQFRVDVRRTKCKRVPFLVHWFLRQMHPYIKS